jgi:hypothetical protein
LKLQIELTEWNVLPHLSGRVMNGHALGLTLQRVSVKGGTRQGVDKVAILRGMPQVLFEGVASHELGHVWLAVQVKSLLPMWAEEGFCELLAYRRYQAIGTKESMHYARQTANNPDPIYGEGFRRVIAVAQSLGFPQLVAQLQKTRRMPTI